MKQISVYIVDNNYWVRKGLNLVLGASDDINIVGETDSTTELMSLLGDSQPDILILDVNASENSICELVKNVKQTQRATKVLLISDFEPDFSVLQILKVGVDGFINKQSDQKELKIAIKALAKGGDYFSESIQKLITHGFQTDDGQDLSLSEREIQILRFICKGRSNEQIADLLFLSEKTITTHRRNIMRKARVSKSTELIVWALSNNIIRVGA